MTTLTTLLKNNKLTAPSNKDEDWINYNLKELLSTEFSKNGLIHEHKKHQDWVLYFFNGTLIEKNLPEQINIIETSIQPSNTNNSLIHIAINESNNYKLTSTSKTNEKITIIYETSKNHFGTSAIEIETDSKQTLNIKREFYAAENSHINTYTNIIGADQSRTIMTDSNNNNNGTITDFVDVRLKKDSVYDSLNQTYLSENSRFQNRVFIDEEGVDANLHGLAINEQEQACFYNTHIFHDAENCVSNQLFKSMVKQNATLEYNGKVTVCPHAQQTNSYQLNQNILLDDYANVYSRPQLFIDADDVKCTHGSTTGDINEHEVLYLMSRGLDRLTSRKIVLNAFFEEVFNKPEFKSEQQDIHKILDDIL